MLSKFTKDKERLLQIGYCILVAFLILLICTRSSFLYVYNNWDDANSYFSVGKGIFNGKVPYRDVFDQKGMYLYFMYGISYLMSHTTFAGVFLIEIILGAFYNYSMLSILRLYLNKSLSFFLMPFVMAVTYSSYSFYWGGSAEEYMLPFIGWGLYISIQYFKNLYPKVMPYKQVFIVGLLAGIVANIKFNSLGFFFAFMMMVFIAEVLNKQFAVAFKSCLLFLTGMIAVTIPWFIYFACNHALESWYEGYVYVNVFLYSNLPGEGPTLFERIYELTKLLYNLTLKNIQYFVFIILGLIGFVIYPKTKWIEKINLILLFGFLYLGVYVGGVELPYYSMVLTVFTTIGILILGLLLQWIMKEKNIGDFWCLISLALSIFFVYTASMNTDFMSAKKEDVFLSSFSEIVNQSENPTLLNYGCLDAGLYTICDIVPTCRWFQSQTLAIPTVEEEQTRYIEEGLIDYVLVRDRIPGNISVHYDLVAEQEQSMNEQVFHYYLYEKVR